MISFNIKTFTLIELLIGIVIIGTLSVSVIPRITGGQVAARNIARKAQITQLYTAIKSYEIQHNNAPVTLGNLVPNNITSLPSDPQGLSACNNASTTSGSYGYITANDHIALLAQVESAGRGLPRDELYLLSGANPCNISISTIYNSVCTSKPGRKESNPLRASAFHVVQKYISLTLDQVYAQESAPTCNGRTATIWVNSSNIIVGGPNNGQTYNGSNLIGGSRNTAGHVVVGTNGDDIINGAYLNGNDTICGLDGNDTIYGQQGDDWIDGGYGNDMIDGGEGNDILYGGGGDDTIHGGNGNDTSYGGDGNDTIYSTYGNDKIYGQNGNDILHGAEGGNDEIYGGDGDDIIDGKSGINTLDGGAGNDTIHGGNDRDIIYGGPGNDTINAGHGMNEIYGGDGDDNITSGNDDDNITGGPGNDTINAGHGHNVMYGGPGNDILVGGGGSDRISGGPGADRFEGGWGSNTCTDFNPDEDTSIDPSIHTSGCNSTSVSNRGRDGIDPSINQDDDPTEPTNNTPSGGVNCGLYSSLPNNHKLYYILIKKL